jgi:hypothetical protein
MQTEKIKQALVILNELQVLTKDKPVKLNEVKKTPLHLNIPQLVWFCESLFLINDIQLEKVIELLESEVKND